LSVIILLLLTAAMFGATVDLY